MGILEVEKPQPKAGQILIKVAYCGICATDYDNFRGTTSFARNGELRYPLRFGHEWAGVVCAVGEGVTEYAIGDKVIGDGKITCGVCENCRAGRWYNCLNLRAIGTVHDHWPGGMAEYILMPVRNTFKLGADISLREGALCEPVTIAMNGLRESNIEGATVMVIGSGAIGLGGVAAAKAKGAKRIICVGRKQSKLDRALQMGATDVINTSRGSLKEQLLQINDGRKAQFVLETSGCTDYVEQCLDLVEKMGTMSMVGFYDRPLTGFQLDPFVYNKLTLRGASGSQQHTPIVVDLLNRHKLSLLPMLTHEIDFSQIMQAMDLYEQASQDRVKMLVKISGEDVGSDLS